MTEVEDLRAATRECHEAMKDMKLLMRDARVLIAEIHAAAYSDVHDEIRAAVQERAHIGFGARPLVSFGAGVAALGVGAGAAQAPSSATRGSDAAFFMGKGRSGG